MLRAFKYLYILKVETFYFLNPIQRWGTATLLAISTKYREITDLTAIFIKEIRKQLCGFMVWQIIHKSSLQGIFINSNKSQQSFFLPEIRITKVFLLQKLFVCHTNKHCLYEILWPGRISSSLIELIASLFIKLNYNVYIQGGRERSRHKITIRERTQ